MKAQQYPCGATGGNRDPLGATTIATVSGDCSKNCEDLAGYDSAISSATDKYQVAGGKYDCDSVYVDADGDNYPTCIDQDDSNPRVWVKKTGNETHCDGWDNDGDSTIDDGFTACAKDQKRIYRADAMQGNALGAVNLLTGAASRVDHLATIQGPHGPLPLTLFYNAQRETNESGVSSGWTNGLTVYLKQQPSGDNRWRITLGSGEEQYFRCTSWANDMSCVIDDHHIAGNLRRISQTFYYYPADGTRYSFDDTSFTTARLYAQHIDGGGFRISLATQSSELPSTIETANSSIYYYFTYSSGGLSAVHINSTSVKQLLDADATDRGGGLVTLDKIKFASALNTIDSDTYLAYGYASSTQNLTAVTQKCDADSAALTTAEATFDGSDRVATIKDATKDLEIDYTSSTKTTVELNIASGESTSVEFTHNKHYMTTRNSDVHFGGASARTQVFDQHGRPVCVESDDSRMTKFIYADSRRPTRIDFYGKSGDCASGGSVDHKIWNSWGYNSSVQALRLAWTRRTSVFSGSSDCSSSITNCIETKH